MTMRRKRPAYANALLDARRAGDHPSTVMVIYGNDWAVGGGVTRLAVKPGEALGLDWGAVVGVRVDVVDRRRGADVDMTELYAMTGELAREAAHVAIVIDGVRHAAELLALAVRHELRGVWPTWWTEETNQINERNRQRWTMEAEAHLNALLAA